MSEVGKTTHKSRESEEREVVWKPRSRLDTPTPPEGFKYRWVRYTVRNDEDIQNVLGRKRQHYEPVMLEDLPEAERVDYDSVESGRNSGAVRQGDLILMKVPEAIVRQRNAHYEGKARSLQESVDRELGKHQNKTMEIHNDSKTDVHVGKRRPGSTTFDD